MNKIKTEEFLIPLINEEHEIEEKFQKRNFVKKIGTAALVLGALTFPYITYDCVYSLLHPKSKGDLVLASFILAGESLLILAGTAAWIGYRCLLKKRPNLTFQKNNFGK